MIDFLNWVQAHGIFCAGVGANVLLLLISVILMVKGKHVYFNIFLISIGFILLNLAFASAEGYNGAWQVLQYVGAIVLGVLIFIFAMLLSG